MRTRLIAGVALALAGAAAPAADGGDLRAEIGVEGRVFFTAPADPRQSGGDVSLRLQPEFYAEWNDRSTSVTFTPFGRLDSADDERTHWDIREAYLRHRSGDFETRIGVRKVFWGATESAHLVDIINQTDGVENPDGEDKLGQPMLNLAWTRAGHTVDLFVLPYFRERTFPGRHHQFSLAIKGRTAAVRLRAAFHANVRSVRRDRSDLESVRRLLRKRDPPVRHDRGRKGRAVPGRQRARVFAASVHRPDAKGTTLAIGIEKDGLSILRPRGRSAHRTGCS